MSILKELGRIVAILLLVTANIYAGHPLRTDDASTLGNDNFEVELSSEITLDHNYNEISLPIVLTYGLFDNTDISISTCGNHGWVTGVSKASSFGDLYLEVKQIFQTSILDFGLKPFMSLPTGNSSKGFGTGKTTYGLYLLLTKELNWINIYSQLGYQRNNNIVNEDHDHWDFSIAAEVHLTEKISVVFETGSARDLTPHEEEHPVFILSGLIYSVTQNIMFDFGLLKGLNETETDLGLLTGITFAL